ncbi:MAG TPA: sigma-70 family RNA polymerase sigma factor [Clostridia bacterium]|jgi:RNA polymerase sigma factor (sigma-70 family)|nr:sigma-70 family RNA polymerase sigma factor [Clostridia bacterium]
MYSIDEERLVADYTPLVRKMARKYSEKCGLELEDLIQEGYLALILALRKFEPERKIPLAGYLKAKVEQGIWGYCRREMSKNEFSAEDKILEFFREGEKAGEENSGFWQDVFQLLSAKQRKALYLIYFADLSLEEVGKRLNCSRQAVYRLKSRALIKLREILLQKVD